MTSQPSMVHAMPLPEAMMDGYTHEYGIFKVVIVTFVSGLLIGGALLLAIVSLNRIRLKQEKASQIASASLGNPRAGCEKGDTLVRAKKCAYIIMSYDQNGTFRAHGTGISLGDGYIVTNKHVVKDGTNFKTRIGGTESEIRLVQSSTQYDVSLLKTQASLPSCPFFDADKLAQGEELYALGWPKEKDQSDPAVTRGIFSRYNTQKDGQQYIQTDAAINPGNSGGPLANECGIVGMNTAKFSWFNDVPTEGLSLAMPAKRVLEIVASLKR